MEHLIPSGFQVFSQGDWVVAALAVAMKWLRINRGNIKGLVNLGLPWVGRYGIGENATSWDSSKGDSMSQYYPGNCHIWTSKNIKRSRMSWDVNNGQSHDLSKQQIMSRHMTSRLLSLSALFSSRYHNASKIPRHNWQMATNPPFTQMSYLLLPRLSLLGPLLDLKNENIWKEISKDISSRIRLSMIKYHVFFRITTKMKRLFA